MIQVNDLLRTARDLEFLVRPTDLDAVETERKQWVEGGLTVRVLRGRKMRTLAGLFDEFAAALQFPLYFGENEAAFDESIADLEGVPANSGLVLLVADANEVLTTEADAHLAWLVRSLRAAAAEWAEPIALGEWWDRPGVPFHVVLVCDEQARDVTISRWRAAGARCSVG